MKDNDKKDCWDVMWDIAGMAITGLIVLTILDIVLTCMASVF